MSRGLLFLACVLLLVNLSHCGLQTGDMRLAGGKRSHEGRVEVYIAGVWGTVCDDGWDIKEAIVVCRHLNFPSAREAVDGGRYGPGQGPIYLDELNCLGTETDLTKCESSGLGISDCKHAEDAGVVCASDSTKKPVELFVEHSTTISGFLGELFESGRDCDLILSVVVENSTVETICAHKLILSLVPSWSSEANLSIEVSSKCQPHVAYFVRYLYTGRMNITMTSSHCLHKLASEWGLKALQEEVGKLLILLLPEDATFQAQSSLFDYAVSMDDGALQQSCLRYMAWNCEALVASPAWTGLSVHAIKGLLSRTDLTVPSEYFVIQALEKWEDAQGKALGSGDQFDLLKLIRFPMVSAEDLNRLKDSRYQAGKLEGFQFNALTIGNLFGELMSNWKSYTPRIYTGKPWSYTFTSEEVSVFKKTSLYPKGLNHGELAFTFRTPVHNSAYFALFGDIGWYTRLFVKSDECSYSSTRVCPSAKLSLENGNSALPELYKNAIVYKNKIVIRCDGRYVSHIQDFKHPQEDTTIQPNHGSGQVYPCRSDEYSYTMVIRPKYRTGLNYTEVEEE
ncbi:galectin-3-binding protein A-like isoform X2 [Gadus morhua]|uniref:galectin-3-binding protein A-like isoform X2 n=1 Tax=Gadus morhua TaxID=8049 RepID=UPI0011B5467E|nr:galectin-3-binding protein A-like isoform X2 [Gadus morhua]